LGWDALIAHLEVVKVPGNHSSLVKEPNVTVVTRHLRKLLESAARESQRAAE
jgi:phthiocerol/phenolphthiocerol synthesis type-I polyketide synthase D